MSKSQFFNFASRNDLDAQMSKDVERQLIEGIELRGKATLVVSGGSTPKGFFQMLSRKAIDWSRVTVTLADDRWVPPHHEDSNDRLVRENLLQGPASVARFIPLVNDDAHPRTAAALMSDHIAELGTVDVMILGMGGDGHFASLFPDSDALEAGLDLANEDTLIAVDPPVAPHARISMTLSRILNSRQLILHIVGEEKQALLRTADLEAAPEILPIAALMTQDYLPVNVYWAP
ncbi:6-phosphogluconolactonase [Congregibacter brevis]|uniref:6-phosphogluconolactonase n=1 Tax=Congregibacter brevis TaxID=3081201 RepID=A0ABZ0IDS6_9GAMM|nr:6-phosphogluconolactonase [Congregibacter sp. IMCC45268]